MTDSSGTTIYTYDNRDQVLSKATPQGTLTYTYDLAGNVASVVSSNANGTSIGYAYDQNNRLASVTDNRTGGTTGYAYDATNQLSSFAYPNGVAHSYVYDNRDRLISLMLIRTGSILADHSQTFSFSGRKQIAAEGTGRTSSYSYDPIYRLLGENITGDPSPANNGLLNYTLDPVGNRLSLTSTLAALPGQSFTFDNNDRVSGDAFDNNGNTTQSGGVNYNHDFEDRLVVTSTGVLVVYDGDGNRVSETTAGVTTKFLVDEFNPTGYAQVAEEIVNGTVMAQYTHGLMRVSQSRLGTVHYYGYDGGSSVRQLFDAGGVVTDTYAYDGFGNTVARTGTTVNPYLYRGEQQDQSLGLYYLRARWYRPQLGLFLEADPDEGFDYRPETKRRYAYGESDPVNMRDPSGMNADTAQIYAFDAELLKEFTSVVAGALGVCFAEGCTLEHRGKWQAQGSDFANAGVGVTQAWNMRAAPPRVLGQLMLTALMTGLSPTQFQNRVLAYARAMAFVSTTGPLAAGFRTSFPWRGRQQVRTYFTNNRTCPAGDCRIDFEVSSGWAFVF